MMKLSFLEPLFAEPGPWASVQLDTSQDIDDPGRAIDLRRRHLRDALRVQGADTATVSALDTAADLRQELPGGRHGRAVFAAHGHVVMTAALPEPPVRDTARFGALPDALPLAVQRAPDIPYLAVRLLRDCRASQDGAQGVHRTSAHVQVIAETGRWPLARVRPGPRFSHLVPLEEWPYTAPHIARHLDELADRHRAEVVVLGHAPEDSWAAGVLVNRMPIHLQNRVALVGPGDDVTDRATGRALLETEAARVLDRRLSAEDRRQVDTFHAQRARHPHKSEGITAAVTALQRAQTRSLLLTRSPALPEALWWAEEPPWIALSAGEFDTFGVTAPRAEPAGAVLLHAAVRTGTDLVVLPPDETPSTEGVAVLLRYRDPADMAPV
ncbi:hypothetical protein ACH47Z_33530 [Streptomyces sp. NPDC020192]|uniref:baeRF2 domain-containing protein n=1 Tax=Streptomyces sp. NPDC020192 TaxID=3365066 RepID=UPI0037B99543